MKIVTNFYVSFILLFFNLNLWAYEPPTFYLSPSVHYTANIPFQAHIGPAPNGSYLAMTLPFAPINQVRQQIDILLQKNNPTSKNLKHRGEAHITVITPDEYENELKDIIKMAEINQLAIKYRLQAAQFAVLCLGVGTAKLKAVDAFTYYLVVFSKDLLNFRSALKKLFVARGGNPQVFNPIHYYPHITVGFTIDDLHEKNGVIKDIKSCQGKIVYK